MSEILRYSYFLKITLLVAIGSCVKPTEPSQESQTFHAPPKAEAYPDETIQKFAKAQKSRESYTPRTRHLRKDGWAEYTNRLFLETSPYLLQHAHNPVNWFPWSNEAFEAAASLKRPVLLSVGYSTCHWCHVMEEESFEDLEIATYLNENYIAIKVDREERPDVDGVYMSAVQALTGQGGWPMNVWLTPDRKPFFGGTYFPARDGDRGVRTGFLSILKQIKKVYDDDPSRVASSAQEITEAIQTANSEPDGPHATHESLAKAAKFYAARFDQVHGGMSGSPKFPSSLPLRFLLREHMRTGEKSWLDMAVLTAKKMALGGIYDQVGGGFHRYSTDAEWLVPHFEKMLYDNALLAVAYLELFQITRDENFERIAREILQYVEREMTSPQGAFYSATDADSKNDSGEREEGIFFTWTPLELEKILGKADAKMGEKFFSVTPNGNYEGRTILTAEDVRPEEAKIAKMRELLYHAREKRPKPIRDEKILTAWNALMISAYSRAGFALSEEKYVSIAKTAAQFVMANLQKNGRLYRSYKDGEAKQPAFLDDYAFFIAALLDLFETTSEIKWLKEAVRLDLELANEFEDKNKGGFYLTANSHEKMIAREMPSYDGAEPSGNSVAALNLLRLFEFTTKTEYKQRAEKLFAVFSKTLNEHPAALSEMLIALDFKVGGVEEIVIVTPKDKKGQAEPFLKELRKRFLPHKVVCVAEEGKELDAFAKLIPWVADKGVRKGDSTAYVCQNQVCQFPTTDPKAFANQLLKSQMKK